MLPFEFSIFPLSSLFPLFHTESLSLFTFAAITVLLQLIHFFHNVSIVELLHSSTTTQSHWSSGLTACSLPRRAAARVPGMHHTPGTEILLIVLFATLVTPT